MLAKMLTRTVKASFHRSDTRIENFGDLRMAAALLDQRQQRTILRPELREGVPEGIQLLRIHRARRLRDVFVLFAKREKDPPQLLPPELVDAGIARQTEEPGLKLRRRLQTIDRSDHLDKHLLGQVFDIIAPARHSIDEASHAVLVTDNELPLGGFVALLSSAHQVGQCGR